MDVRRRISFNMNTGGGQPSTGDTYTVNLNSQWEKTTVISNPDSTLYDGVYRSSSNYNVNSGVAIMYITINNCSSFKMYIRSYAESNYDYVMVSQLDKTITGSTTYSDTTLVKAHTRGNQQSGTALSSYTLVEFTGITSGEHTITVVYRKDSSVNSGDDRGYVLIPKSNGGSGDGEGGSNEGPTNTDNYLTILALEDELTASLSTNACQYCIDGDGNWIDLPAGITTQSINSGQTLSFRGNLSINHSSGIGTFLISKKCNLDGNCMSLLFGDDAVNNYSLSDKDYAFYKLFRDCTTIIQVSETFLPATILDYNCYSEMFYGCTNLTAIPKLPATTLAQRCYYQMFYGCTSLTIIPELLATKLAQDCYNHMFDGCSNLVTAPELPATGLAYGCYSYMFKDCTSLTTAPKLPATSLREQCYMGMFYNCTSLTTAPELPATYMYRACYESMFRGCTSLTTAPKKLGTSMAVNGTIMYYTCSYMFYGCTSLTVAPELPATRLAGGCYQGMFYGCISLTTPPNLPATTLNGSCYESMFEGCTGLITAPSILPATTLALECYYYMFKGCTSLTAAPKLPAITLVDSCYKYMFYRCTSLTTAPELPATTLAESCYGYMFEGCSRLNYIKMLATDISATGCLTYWVNGVASTGTFVKNPAMISLPNSIYGVPKGWIVYNNGEIDIDTTYSMQYTSSDNNIVTPYATNAFDVTITSNIYNDGMGTITFAGPVTSIGNHAFQYCRSLTSVNIPDSVTEIGDYAFYVCQSLTSVYCKATTPPALGNTYVFDANGSGRKIYVPTESVNAYKSAMGWKEYADAIAGYDFENDGDE